MLQTLVIECYREWGISEFPSGKQKQISMLVVSHLSFFFFFSPKASRQFSVELIYDINTKLEITKCYLLKILSKFV